VKHDNCVRQHAIRSAAAVGTRNAQGSLVATVSVQVPVYDAVPAGIDLKPARDVHLPAV